jgi:hypothetical protein
MQIGRGQDMAKALQRLVATSADSVQRYGLDWLKRKLGIHRAGAGFLRCPY